MGVNLSKKFYQLCDNDIECRIVYFCPGCRCSHWLRIRGSHPVWSVTGLDTDTPTVSPSILVNQHDVKRRCHSFIRNGKIEFLVDCYHELAGQTVDLPDFDSSE